MRMTVFLPMAYLSKETRNPQRIAGFGHTTYYYIHMHVAVASNLPKLRTASFENSFPTSFCGIIRGAKF